MLGIFFSKLKPNNNNNNNNNKERCKECLVNKFETMNVYESIQHLARMIVFSLGVEISQKF